MRDVLDLLATGASERPSDSKRCMMVFVIDAQLPPAMARWLSAKGYQAVQVSDVGMQNATDNEIWNLAVAKGR